MSQNSSPRLQEARTLLKYSWPIILTSLLQSTTNLASAITLGNLGSEYLAAFGLATMFCNITGYSFGEGVASALDIICAQSYTGSKDKYALGKHLQRSFIVMTLLYIPVAVAWMYSLDILIACGQNRGISRTAADIVKLLLPGLLPQFYNQCLQKYLQAQGFMAPGLYIMLIICPINLFLQYFLVYSPFSIGLIGSPIATSITNILQLFLATLYIKYVNGSQRWAGFDLREAMNFKLLGQYLKICLATIGIACTEWWTYEILALIAGLMGEQSLATQAAIINTVVLLYRIQTGFVIATSTRVAHSLGLDKHYEAKIAAQSGLMIGAISAIANPLIIYAFKDRWGRIFTSDPAVIESIANLIPYTTVFMVSDAMNSIGFGILRGSGSQNLGTALNIVGYYVVGIPLGLLLVYVFHFSLSGLWIGLAVGAYIITILLACIIANFDWPNLSSKAILLSNNHILAVIRKQSMGRIDLESDALTIRKSSIFVF